MHRNAFLAATALFLCAASACPPPSAMVTSKKFRKITTDMTYEAVVRIMGAKGEKIATSTVKEITVESWAWKEKAGPYMAVIFVNGKVAGKAMDNKKWSRVQQKLKSLLGRVQHDVTRRLMEQKKREMLR